ncbi:unnamed protein product [Effrenium voratum]|nr:unnamed protein product [Effrenium voratum]
MADQHAVREVFNSPSGISRTSSRTLHPKVPPELKRSPAWLALRVYHVWCMLVGLCITVLTVVEAFLALYVSLFSNPWVSGNQAESMCIAAACLLSAMLLSWGSNVCHAGVMLVFDAARNDAFIVYRALFCLASINSRTGLPVLKTRSTPGLWKARADLAVQCLLLYGPLDLLPILVSLSTGSATDWLVWVAWVSFCEMLLFWVLVCINDYVGKFQALWRLASQERRPRSWTAQMELRPPLLDEETKEEVSEDNICMSGCKWLHGQSSWLALAGLVVLAVVAFAVRSGIALIGSTLLIIFSILHLLQRHCVPGRSLERGAIIASEQDRRSLLASLDDHLCLTQDIELSRGGGVRLLLSAGAQLVDDVGGSDPGMIGYLRTAALGSPVAFRLQSVEPWAVFMETYCGGSPDQIMQGSLVWMVSGAVICSVLFITRHYVEGLCGLAVMVLLSFPAVSLAVCPQYAHLCHACISLGVAVLALLSTACATRGPSYLSFIGICLCAASHCLLPRKIQHKGRASLLFTLIFTAVMSSLISVSLGALVKGELEAPHFLPGTFRFPSDGRMNWWGAENFTAAPCTIQMGTTDDNVLALVDFALFNKLVYMPDHHLEIHLRQWLPGWKMVHQQRREQRCSPSDESCDIQDWTSWFVFQGQPGTALEKTTVVTVRGTKTDLDYILDLDFWPGAQRRRTLPRVFQG